MRLDGELGVALAVVAAIVGAGFASGREIAAFFSQTGWASWAGVVCAAAAMGALAAMLAEFARRTGARGFPELYAAVMSPACGDAVRVLHGMTMLLTAAVMLTAGGELGALVVPIVRAYPLSLAGTLALGLLLSRRDFRPLRRLGAVLAPLVALFYLALALDGSPAPVEGLWMPVEAEELSGNLLAAMFLGFLYAALNAAMSGGVLAGLCRAGIRPRRVGWLTGTLLLLLLAPANAALVRGGAEARRLALPSVALAARWGMAGYYVSVSVLYLSALTTLTAALGCLRGQAAALGLNPRLGTVAAGLAAACLSVIGFQSLVRVGYPMLGWGCALTLLSQTVILREEKKD